MQAIQFIDHWNGLELSEPTSGRYWRQWARSSCMSWISLGEKGERGIMAGELRILRQEARPDPWEPTCTKTNMIFFLVNKYGEKMKFDEKLRQQDEGDEGKKYHDTLNFVPDLAYPWVARLRRNKIIPFISEQNIVLEYGVGTGWNIAELTCRRRIGYDLGDHLEAILRKHNIEFVNDINVVSDESIDVVICHHVLEHTSNPPDILKQIWRILVKNGKLLLFVPFGTGKKYRHYDPQEPNHHLYSWNVQTLGNLVEIMDFKIENGSIGQYGYDRFSSVWADRLHIGEFGFRFIRSLIHLIKPGREVFFVALKELR